MSIAVATPIIARKKPFAPQAARIGLYVFLTVSAIFFLLPLLLVAMNSLKSLEEIRQGNLLAFPANPSFDAWVAAWKTACTGLDCNGVRPGVWNSIKITVPAVVISTLAGALNGYALAQWKSRHANLLMLLSAFTGNNRN